MCSPDISAYFWPVEWKAVSGGFCSRHLESNMGLFRGVNRSGCKGRGKSGGVRESLGANETLDPSNSISNRRIDHERCDIHDGYV